MASEGMKDDQLVNVQIPDVLIEKGIELFEKAYNDISLLTGGIAVKITNVSGLTIALSMPPIFFDDWGSFGMFTPQARILDNEVAAFDMNFSASSEGLIPFVGPFLTKLALQSMLVYQSEEFDLGIGVYFYVNGGVHGPYALCTAAPKNGLTSRDRASLLNDLKQNSKSEAQLFSASTNVSIYSVLRRPGLHSYGLDVTLFRSAEDK